MENEHQLNKLVAEKVMEWEFDSNNESWITEFGTLNFIDEVDSEWNPSTDIEDAWWVTEKFFRVEIETGKGAIEHLVTIRDEAGWTIAYHYGETVTLAICYAALKARGVQIETLKSTN
ncbi:BC1872 family protein [Fictibacillus sp. JL2B1089]|uniref:BC1872 family protein n=1 Tax=Fictibacillus sp. JL2B1089 TaxID=3399565 RepID=UPI003A89C121